jgi:hypothetical protein
LLEFGALSGLLMWFWWPPAVGHGLRWVALGLSAKGDRVCRCQRVVAGFAVQRAVLRCAASRFLALAPAHPAFLRRVRRVLGGGLGAGCGRLRRVALAAMGRARRGIPSETVASFGDTPSGPAALGTGVSF